MNLVHNTLFSVELVHFVLFPFFGGWAKTPIYGLFNTLTVCIPKEEEKFINLLKDKCPNIKIIDKPLK